MEQAQNDQYECCFIETNGNTRNCYTIIQNDGEKTEINEYGDHINLQYFTTLIADLEALIKSNDVSAISLNGSLPPTEVQNFYPQIITKIRQLNPKIKIILDTSGQALAEVLKSNVLPDFIKPNEQEAADLLSSPVTRDCNLLKEEIIHSPLTSIPNIIVSLGDKGALVKHRQNFYKASFNPVKVVNTEGSGDSVVGGLLYGLDQHYNFEDTIKYAIAAGTANAMETKTGFVQPENVLKISQTIKITSL